MVTIAVGGALVATLGPEASRGVFVATAGGVGGTVGARCVAVRAHPRAAPGDRGVRTPLAEARAGAALLRRVKGFRRFLLARGLLAVTEVAVPFYVLAAREAGVDASGLGAWARPAAADVE